MWVHGHSIQPENPALTVGRIGWAGQIRTLDSAGWYHIAIPTTVIVTDIRQRIDSAMVQFGTGTQGFLRNFHVYDGQNRIANYDNLNITGAGLFDKVHASRTTVCWFGDRNLHESRFGP